MIQSPGLNSPGTHPEWLPEIQICDRFKLSEQQYAETSITWKLWAMTFMRGVARGEEQRARREKLKK